MVRVSMLLIPNSVDHFKGDTYNVTTIVNDKFEIDMASYEQQGRINLSMFFALTYGIGFAAVISTLTHYHNNDDMCREIYQQFRASYNGKEDIHTKLMKKYEDIPLGSKAMVSYYHVRTPGLNIITEYLMGIIIPGRPIADACFKTYGYISMTQAVSFLNDFKLGHDMKIPPGSMFLVQFIRTIIAGTVNISVAWRLLTLITVENICQDLLLLQTVRGHALVTVSSLMHLGSVLLESTAAMPPATTLNFISLISVGTVFNFFVFRYRKVWWQRYNYALSAAMDAGLAFMGVLLYFSLSMQDISLNWWVANGKQCNLATCPTAKGIAVDGCPLL
ncbi:Oligopeptide transporter, OPT superfamily [Dillenia turbinata]|uniref:Oligopeptide transporter, OPT superfamily n=1 Tax=Dillenia turbinata TaxID=194707 RepID=A0AAN8ZGK0_9MAGN